MEALSLNKNTKKNLLEKDSIVGNVLTIDKKNVNMYGTKQLLKHSHAFQILPHCGVFIQKDVFNRVGGYDLRYQIAADIEFFNRALRKANASFIYLDHTISVFYKDGISSTLWGRLMARKEEIQIHWKYYGVLSTLRKIIPLPPLGMLIAIKSRCSSLQNKNKG